jgi:aspartyl-tRNA(Asn)/glutamyl-tRNA(Gln) amidotransferase subunit C
MPEINIRHIAKLAKLHVDENEITKLEKQMGEMVTMVENLPEFENTAIELKKEDAMKLREDTVVESPKRDVILENAPKTEAGCIVVPKIVEE